MRIRITDNVNVIKLNRGVVSESIRAIDRIMLIGKG